MNAQTKLDILIEKGYEDVIIFRNPDYTDAIIGLTPNNNVVYNYDLMIEWLIEHENMDYNDAADFISFNDSFYYGEHYPVIYYWEMIEEELSKEDPDYKPLVFVRIEDLPIKLINFKNNQTTIDKLWKIW